MTTQFRLSELLDRAGMSQREVAKASRVSLRTVSRLCTNDTSSVALDVLDRLAAVLGVKSGDLLKGPAKPGRGPNRLAPGKKA